MKAIIIEDSRLARKELKMLLNEHPSIDIIAEASNAEVAVELLQKEEVDLIFLDIHLPGKNGFEILEELDQVPRIIFTTAYDEYAIKAFEYNTLDYLLKPIKPERLAQAIQKLEVAVQNQPPNTAQYMNEESQVFVKDGEKCWIVKLKEIRLLEVCGNYTRIFFEENKPMILKSLNYLEGRLDPKIFIRINRQQIINMKWIDKIDPWFNGQLKIKLKGGEELEVSRRKSQKIKDLLSF